MQKTAPVLQRPLTQGAAPGQSLLLLQEHCPCVCPLGITQFWSTPHCALAVQLGANAQFPLTGG